MATHRHAGPTSAQNLRVVRGFSRITHATMLFASHVRSNRSLWHAHCPYALSRRRFHALGDGQERADGGAG